MSVSEVPVLGKSRHVGITVQVSGSRGQAQQTQQDAAWKGELGIKGMQSCSLERGGGWARCHLQAMRTVLGRQHSGVLQA